MPPTFFIKTKQKKKHSTIFQISWSNIKRQTKAKALTGFEENYNQLDHIVLDIIGPSIGITTEPLPLDQSDFNEPEFVSSFMLDTEIMDSSDLAKISDFANQKPTVFTEAHKKQLALLIKNNEEVLLGTNSSKAEKNKKWEEMYSQLLSQGAQISGLQHLRRVNKSFKLSNSHILYFSQIIYSNSDV